MQNQTELTIRLTVLERHVALLKAIKAAQLARRLQHDRHLPALLRRQAN